MTTEQKRLFVHDLMETVKTSILEKIPAMPEDWNGFELRQYVTDKFAENAILLRGNLKKKYKNDVIVNNL